MQARIPNRDIAEGDDDACFLPRAGTALVKKVMVARQVIDAAARRIDPSERTNAHTNYTGQVCMAAPARDSCEHEPRVSGLGRVTGRRVRVLFLGG